MAGRLDSLDSFVATARGVSDGDREPVREDRGLRGTKDALDAENPEILFERSRSEGIVLMIFYVKMEDGRPRGVRRLVVAPRNRLLRSRRPPLYVELVDVLSRRRKCFRRDRLTKVVPARGVKPVGWDPSKITFR